MSTPAPLFASHTFAVPSWLAVTTRAPSGLNDAEVTSRVCRFSVSSSAPLFASQTFAVLSSLAVTTRARQAERRRIDRTGVPLQREQLRALFASQTFAVLS
ncbi:MAG: hypothetical protein U0835_10995 [Isosphaeraceae bacterium]